MIFSLCSIAFQVKKQAMFSVRVVRYLSFWGNPRFNVSVYVQCKED